jgi:hypothetical protein
MSRNVPCNVCATRHPIVEKIYFFLLSKQMMKLIYVGKFFRFIRVNYLRSILCVCINKYIYLYLYIYTHVRVKFSFSH